MTNPRLQPSSIDHDNVGSFGNGTLTYIIVAERSTFDKIALPLKDHGENDNGHLLSKSMDQDGVYIVFQHWLKERTIQAIIEDNAAEKAARAAAPMI